MRNTAAFLLITILITAAFIKTAGAFIYDDKGRRDPFAVLVDEKGRYLLDSSVSYSSEELKLNGILWDPEGRSSALINGEVFTVGECAAGYSIKEIRENSIIVSKNNREFVLWLAVEEQIKGEGE